MKLYPTASSVRHSNYLNTGRLAVVMPSRGSPHPWAGVLDCLGV